LSKTATPAQKNGVQKNGKSPKTELIPVDFHPEIISEPVPNTGASKLPDIPYLGETRKLALAVAGLRTLEDLRAATVEQIGGIKGVGMVNAARVKEWLAIQDAMPAVAAVTPIPVTDSSASATASANQNVQDAFQKIGSATARLKETIAPKARDKALDRQLNKLDTVASELAEGPDTLSVKRVQEAVKTLDKIAALLETAAGTEKMSPKKQAVLIEELRARRKRLQKALGD
jgi:hypothetical protein